MSDDGRDLVQTIFLALQAAELKPDEDTRQALLCAAGSLYVLHGVSQGVWMAEARSVYESCVRHRPEMERAKARRGKA